MQSTVSRGQREEGKMSNQFCRVFSREEATKTVRMIGRQRCAG